MKKGLNLQVVLVLLVVFLAVLMLAGCGTKASKAPEQQAPKEAPTSPATDSKPGAKGQPTATAPAKSSAPIKGGTLTIAMEKEITNMNPQINTQSVNASVRKLIYEGLLDRTKNDELKPGLAEKWQVSPDGREITFYLRKNVKFHNGKTMTVKDVKWSVEYVMDPKNAAYGRSTFEKVKSVETTDDTIKFTLEAPDPAFLVYLSTIQPMAVVPEGSLPTGADKLDAFPPGTGPFKYVEYKAGQHIALARFDDYWGQVPYLDKLILRPVPDENVRFAALRAGDLDIIERAPYQWVKQIKSGEVKGINIAESAGGIVRRIVFNVKKPPFDNVKVRQAVAYAFNKQQYLEAGYWGFGTPNNENVSKGSSWHLGVPDIKRDTNKARELLKEAGYPEGLEVTLTGRQGVEVTSQAIQQQLAEAGIKVKLEIVESSVESLRRRNGDFQFSNTGIRFINDPALIATDFMTENSEKRGDNFSGYSDPAMDSLLKRLAAETDTKKRKDLYRQVMEKLWQDLPEMYIGSIPAFWAYKDKIKEFEPDYEEYMVYAGGGINYTWIDK